MNIRNYISLRDEMSPTLRSIDKAMQTTIRNMEQLDAQTKRLQQARTAGGNNQVSVEERLAEQERMMYQRHYLQLERMSMQHQSRMEQIAARTRDAMFGGGGGGGFSPFNLMNLYAALFIINNIKDAFMSIMEAQDQAISTRARLDLFNTSQYTPDQLYGQVFKTALKTRTGLEETSNLATRTLISGAMTGPEASVGALKFTELVNKAVIAGGGTSEENRRALLQLSQSLASGVMQGDELRAIREQTPYLMKILAEGLGKVEDKFAGATIGDMKKLGKDGELTSERIVKAMFAMEDEVNKAFAKMPRTFGQAMTQITSIWQYFLFLLGQGDGILARIRDKAWELADYLTSEEGFTFLSKLAGLLTTIGNTFMWLVEQVINGCIWMSDHVELVSSVLTALGLVMLVTAGYALVMWAAVSWPLLLIVGLLSMVIYAIIQTGVSTGTVVATIIGILAVLFAVIYNIFVSIISVVYMVLAVIYNSFATTFNLMASVLAGVVAGLVGIFHGFGYTVLEIILKIAQAIDHVFGSNLAAGVSGWIDSLDGKVGKLEKSLLALAGSDPLRGNTDPFALRNEFVLKDLTDTYNNGKNSVNGILGTLKGISVNLNQQDLLNKFNLDKLGYTQGGNLDSVGEIKKPVEISDEDLEMLKSIAAREFMLNLTQLTPKIDVSFGDVRETADVRKILEVIEEMLAEAAATSLVGE